MAMPNPKMSAPYQATLLSVWFTRLRRTATTRRHTERMTA